MAPVQAADDAVQPTQPLSLLALDKYDPVNATAAMNYVSVNVPGTCLMLLAALRLVALST